MGKALEWLRAGAAGQQQWKDIVILTTNKTSLVYNQMSRPAFIGPLCVTQKVGTIVPALWACHEERVREGQAVPLVLLALLQSFG